jgi:type II restriction/modification system DNA methylase subunit YeeA
MNTGNIKSYAPKARNAFIAAMTKQAAKYGITVNGIEPMEQRGDLALIGDSAFPKTITGPRNALAKLVEQQGFVQTMEQAAYSWFNRLCAIRFMELKGYLEHGRRVLSHPADPQGFQILEDCLEIDISGMDKQRIQELKLDGTQDETLYRELLLAQCHALHETMPFLFEALDDATELLLPDNLTKTDSLIRELVCAIPEEDWEQVEIIGWLYQFYISEKKDQVIGKVVKSEDIPAATQLFTPNWIVQYLVQNSVGRQWLQTYPDSPLKDKMPYYIESAEQTEDVQAQLNAITPDSIDPESIKVLDPACGSGHILVEAYKVLKAIYEERGYRGRDIPKLILENNLFGLDIDDRAGQLAGFALIMLAREDDRRIFSRDLKLNILSLQESTHLDLKSIWQALNLSGDWQRGSSQNLFDSEQVDLSSAKADNRYQLLQRTLDRFSQAKTFGSLIDVPAEEEVPLKGLLGELEQLVKAGDSMQKPTAEQLIPYVKQAWVLAQRYDAVVANPPYMGRKGMYSELKPFLKNNYASCIWDIYAAFIEKSAELAKSNGRVSLITMQSWMFLPAFDDLRNKVLSATVIENLIHLGSRAFDSISGEVVRTCAFVCSRFSLEAYVPKFLDLRDGSNESEKKQMLLDRVNECSQISIMDFKRLPGAPLSYWVDLRLLNAFKTQEKIKSYALSESLNLTGDNERFLRFFWEVKAQDIIERSKWIFYAKGGKLRKWYGNFDYVVNWKPETVEYYKKNKTARLISEDCWQKKGITWSMVTSGKPGFRLLPSEAMFDVGGASIVFEDEHIPRLMCFLNSPVAESMIRLFNETKIQLGNVTPLPLVFPNFDYKTTYDELVDLHKTDWDEFEISFDFRKSPLLPSNINKSLMSSYQSWRKCSEGRLMRVKSLEESVNEKFISSYDLVGLLNSEVPLEEVTLMTNPLYRYGDMKDADNRFQSDSIAEYLSYAIGCIMGRYSLDRDGLVYVRAGNQGFSDLIAEGTYQTFAADDDGIIPLNDQEWFPDDVTNRFREFVKTVWGEDHLQENLDFIAESLCLNAIKPKRGESALDTIRRYLSTQFYKEHLKAYKKRPIYWLFSSGKQKAFECLIYLHRYNEGTLARMRTEYVIPLTAKLNTYVEKLEQDKEASSSAA